MQYYSLRKLGPDIPQFVIAEQNSHIIFSALNFYSNIIANIAINYSKQGHDIYASGKL